LFIEGASVDSIFDGADGSWLVFTQNPTPISSAIEEDDGSSSGGDGKGKWCGGDRSGGDNGSGARKRYHLLRLGGATTAVTMAATTMAMAEEVISILDSMHFSRACTGHLGLRFCCCCTWG